MAKIAISGYGKMGKIIEELLLQAPQHQIVAIIDNDEDWIQQADALVSADVVIDFTTPQTAIDNLRKYAQQHIPVVCGTTGWYDHLEEIKTLFKAADTSLIYGSNFSIGANLFFKLNEQLAQWMNAQPHYDVTIEETHHTAKLDIPSGTAITIAQIILNQLDRKNSWTLAPSDSTTEISINAQRISDVNGIHKVVYESDEDTIEICHTAKSRKAFAQGAIKAAEWLLENPGIYDFKKTFLRD
ncbi:MAG: 4-hydroxy-tetrahydrodipicolinate reductase [Bacteroidales bacterium]|nr:4-hydroxy-tetrahydrodipicolinate reductase [Bacteroidales bacterium]